MIEALEETTISLKSVSLPTLSVIRIGSAHEFFREKVLPRILRYPVRTVSHFGTADLLLELLQEDKVDLIITSKKLHASGIEYVKLLEEEFVVVAPGQWVLPELDSMKAKEEWLSAQNWLSYGLELPIIRRFWREYYKKRPIIKPVHVIPDLHMIVEAIENGAGISLIPTYLLEKSIHEGKIQVVWKELSVTNEIFIAYQLKNKHLPQIQQIIQILQQTA